jgi:GAF domain-containing protein
MAPHETGRPRGAPPDGYSPGSQHPPRLDLNELLTQLVERARSVIGVQDRFAALLRASQVIVSDLEPSTALRRIVEVARKLGRARYAALTVLRPDGGLEQFLHVGCDDETVAAIGRLPEGKGLLGALGDEPQVIRLAHIRDDHRSVGFPTGHPPMDSLLIVPIRVRDEVYGNLYLTGCEDGEFTAEDEDVVSALAAAAATAIGNARLYAESNRREEWQRASTEITRQLLLSEGERPSLRVIAERLRDTAEADLVLVFLPAGGGQMRIEAAVGVGEDRLVGATHPLEGTLSGQAISTGRAAIIDDVQRESGNAAGLSAVAPFGPVMVIPLAGLRGPRGAIVATRLRSRRAFDKAELDMATTFANHAAAALELADASAAQHRMTLLEDRDRVARDLQDHAIQRLFGVGLAVQSVAAGLGDDQRAARLNRVVQDLDETIRQIRRSIFELPAP